MNAFVKDYKIPKKDLVFNSESIEICEPSTLKLVNIKKNCMYASMPTSNSSGNNQIFSVALVRAFV